MSELSGDSLELLTVEQVAEMFQVSLTWVHRASRSGRLKSVKLSHRVLRFRRCDVETYLASL